MDTTRPERQPSQIAGKGSVLGARIGVRGRAIQGQRQHAPKHEEAGRVWELEGELALGWSLEQGRARRGSRSLCNRRNLILRK
jgi:hypothetical protein